MIWNKYKDVQNSEKILLDSDLEFYIFRHIEVNYLSDNDAEKMHKSIV